MTCMLIRPKMEPDLAENHVRNICGGLSGNVITPRNENGKGAARMRALDGTFHHLRTNPIWAITWLVPNQVALVNVNSCQEWMV